MAANSEELISQFIDQEALERQKQLVLIALGEMAAKIQSTNDILKTLGGRTNTTETVNGINQLNGAMNGVGKAAEVASNGIAKLNGLNGKSKESIDLLTASEIENEKVKSQLVVTGEKVAAARAEEAKQLAASSAIIKNEGVDYNNLTTIFAKNQTALKALATDKKALDTEYKNGKISTDAYVAALTNINQQQTTLKTQNQGLNQSITNLEKGFQATKGSLNQLRAELNLSIIAFDRLSVEEKKAASGQELQTKITSLTKTISEQEQVTGRFQRSVGHYSEAFKGFKETIGELASGLLVSVGIVGGLQGIISFVDSSIEKFKEFEAATSRLKNTLSNLGQVDAFDRLKEKAEDLSKEFKTFQADEVLDVFQKLIVYGKLTEHQIDQLTPVIVNFAAQQRISLAEATDVITKALEGNARGLKTYGINIKDVKTEAERFGVIMEELAPKVEGAAKAFGETTAGQIKATQVEIDNLKEEIGGKLQPVILKFYQTISLLLERVPDGFKKIGEGINAFGETIKFNIQLLYQFAKGGTDGAVFIAEATAKAAKVQDEYNDSLQRTQAHQIASETATTLSTKSIKEQELTLAAEEERLKALEKAALAFNKANKNNTAEGKAATQNLIQQLEIVNALKNSIEQQKNPLPIGGAGTDTAGVAAVQSARDAAAKLAEEERKKQIEAAAKANELLLQQQANFYLHQSEDEKSSFDTRLGFLNAYYAQQKDVINAATEFQIQNEKLTGDRLVLAKLQGQQKILELTVAFKAKQTAIETGQKNFVDPYIKGLEDQLAKKKLLDKAIENATASRVAIEESIIKGGEDSALTQIAIDSEKRQTALTEAYNKGLITDEEFAKKTVDIQKEAARAALEVQLKAAEEKLKLATPGTKEWDDLFLAIQKVKHAIADTAKPDTSGLDALATKLGEINKIGQDLGSITSNIAGIQFDRENAALDTQLNLLEQKKKKEIEVANQTITNEQDKAAAITVINAKADAEAAIIAQKKRKIAVDQAKVDKAANIVNIITGTAVAVVNALKIPPPFGIIEAAVVGALGLAQLARAIAAPLPQFKHGVKDSPGTYAIVGDGNKHEVIEYPNKNIGITPAKDTITYLPQHSTVYPSIMDFLERREKQTLLKSLQLVPITEKKESNDELIKRVAAVERAIKNNRSNTNFMFDKNELMKVIVESGRQANYYRDNL